MIKKIVAGFSAVAMVIVGTMVLSASASADTRECKTRSIVRTGGQSRFLFLAKKRARDAWRQKAKRLYGNDYSAWYVAKRVGGKKNYDCRKTRRGMNKCKARAIPCKLPVVIKGPGKVCAFYRYEGTGAPSKLKVWAKHNARKAWSAHVKGHYGPKFDTWMLAADKKNVCKEKSDGSYVCVAGAKGCTLKIIR